MGIMETVLEIPAEHEANVFGQFDAFAKKIERSLHVTLISRDGVVKIMGDSNAVERARNVLSQLLELSRRGNTISEQNVNYTLALVMEDSEDNVLEIDKDIICHTLQGKPIKPKTLGQKQYVDEIREKMIVFGLGPAGTGKTYLAMAMAITAFKNNEVGRIILTRPAIEAGERLGFLPQGLQARTVAEGNTSLRGAALLLTRPELRERLVRWSSGCTLVDLAARPDFTALYMRHMVFG